jgi:hypothetical protein
VSRDAAVPPDLWREIDRRIQAAVGQALRSGPLRNASITDGSLTIQNGSVMVRYPETQGGDVAVYWGNIVSTVDGSYLGTGELVQKPDGTDIASFSWDASDGTQTVHLHDDQNNVIIGNDKVTGQGLSRPLIPGVFYPAQFANFVGTSSTTWVTLWRARMTKQLGQLYVRAWAGNDTSGGTGQVRVLVDGVQFGSTVTTGLTITESQYGPAPIAGDHATSVVVEIQAQMVSGTGTVRVGASRLEGWPS